MDRNGDGERVPLHHAPMAGPIPAMLAITTGEPLLPRAGRKVIKLRQRRRVASDPVVVVVSLEFLLQGYVLLTERLVAVTSAPLGDLRERTSESIRGRLPFHHRTSLPRSAPVMGESEEVKRFRRFRRVRPISSCRRTKSN